MQGKAVGGFAHTIPKVACPDGNGNTGPWGGGVAIATLNNDYSNPFLMRSSILWLGMDLETMFKQGWRGGGDILVADLCPRAPPLQRRLLQPRRGAWEVFHERMQIEVCIDDIWKTERVLGSWFVDGRYGFLLRRLGRGGVSDLKFDGVSGVLPRSDSFN
ncbi:Speckle-type POZ protein [Hordeum vulgare]|nr:Speckle-type POZ protein [Hordeum vulgare]